MPFPVAAAFEGISQLLKQAAVLFEELTSTSMACTSLLMFSLAGALQSKSGLPQLVSKNPDEEN